MSVETPTPAPSMDDQWTSQSGPESSGEPEPAPSTPETESPAIADAGTAIAEDAAPSETARNDKGQFTSEPAKKPSKRTNPYEAVKAATGETARERDLRLKAEARAAELEQQLNEARKPKAPEPVKDAQPAAETRKKPSADEIGTKYPSYEDYVEDLADWKLEQRLAKDDLDAKIEARFQARLQQQQQKEHVTGISERGRAAYPDFQEAIDASDVWFSPMHQRAILDTPGSEHIQYALAKDPHLARRIAAIDNPVTLGLEFARLLPSTTAAARPDSASSARPSTAKPPINRVGGTASAAPVDPDDLDFGPEYIKAENERERKRQQAARW